MNSDDELLGQRSVHELEDAERRLRAHLKKRRNKPSLTRRIIGLCISIPMIAFGLFVGIHAIESVQEHFLKFMVFSGGLIVAGLMWIYSDWFE